MSSEEACHHFVSEVRRHIRLKGADERGWMTDYEHFAMYLKLAPCHAMLRVFNAFDWVNILKSYRYIAIYNVYRFQRCDQEIDLREFLIAVYSHGVTENFDLFLKACKVLFINFNKFQNSINFKLFAKV